MKTGRPIQVLASAARTAAINSDDLPSYGHRGLHLVVDVTAYTAGSITLTIQGKDSVSAVYYTLLASAALAATGTTVLKIYPGIPVIANGVANDVMPDTWRVSVAVGGSQSITYSVAAYLVP